MHRALVLLARAIARAHHAWRESAAGRFPMAVEIALLQERLDDRAPRLWRVPPRPAAAPAPLALRAPYAGAAAGTTCSPCHLRLLPPSSWPGLGRRCWGGATSLGCGSNYGERHKALRTLASDGEPALKRKPANSRQGRTRGTWKPGGPGRPPQWYVEQQKEKAEETAQAPAKKMATKRRRKSAKRKKAATSKQLAALEKARAAQAKKRRAAASSKR